MLRAIIVIIAAGIIVATILAGGFFYDSYLIRPEGDVSPVSFTIQSGSSVREIARSLEDAGIISSSVFFQMYAKVTGKQSNLQAGTFELVPGSSLHALVSVLTNAKAQEIQITIPEGYTSAQIGEEVRKALPGISKESWDDAVGRGGVEALDVGEVTSGIPDGQGIEGYLFPDTYRFRVDADAKTVVETMYLTLLRRLSENGIVLPTVLEDLEFDNGLTLHEILTLASIVEREVRAPDDMKIVAGIFFTRMKIGMALQADSTVNYLTGKKDAAVSLEDSKIDSPYNTYQRVGLPPGPISNPGMNAILSVMDPQDSSYLYFLTTADGQVVFANTFSEHVANKQR